MYFNKEKIAKTIVISMLAIFCATHPAKPQSSTNTKLASAYVKADQELNKVYKQILKDYAAQPLFIKNLKVAQRLWIQLRDAELRAKFPKPGSYGSAQPMCEEDYLAQLTRERSKFLRVWLNGIPEGDVCTGSVKIK
jgi:uncharacterized protein YecT (DUF1311 family)